MTGRALEGTGEAARFMEGNLSGVSGAVNGKPGLPGVGHCPFSMAQLSLPPISDHLLGKISYGLGWG
jgi:hypothetical protein